MTIQIQILLIIKS